MPNPNYGDTFYSKFGMPQIKAYAESFGTPGIAPYFTDNVVIPNSSSVSFSFAAASSTPLPLRFAYQIRKRLSADDPTWDGGETWTDWADAGGTVDAWTELYTTGGTATSDVTEGQRTYRVVGFVYNHLYDHSTYDAFEYRVQCWTIQDVSGTIRYGQVATKVIRVDFAPSYAITTSIASAALNAAELQLALWDWPRGARIFTLERVESGTIDIYPGQSLALGDFIVSPFNTTAAGANVTTTAKVYPNGVANTFEPIGYPTGYRITNPLTIVTPDNAVTKPVVSATKNGTTIDFVVNDASYEKVEVLVQWLGGGVTIPAVLDDGKWYATAVPPFNTAIAWKVSGYKTVLGQLLFNSTTSSAPITIPGYGYELRADDGRTVTLTLEAKEQMTTDVDSATITLASGSTIARHGQGNKRTWTLRGQLLGASHSATSDWIDALAILDEPRNLTYRNPYGEVRRVCVSSWSRNPASVWDVVDVSVSFAEVE